MERLDFEVPFIAEIVKPLLYQSEIWASSLHLSGFLAVISATSNVSSDISHIFALDGLFYNLTHFSQLLFMIFWRFLTIFTSCISVVFMSSIRCRSRILAAESNRLSADWRKNVTTWLWRLTAFITQSHKNMKIPSLTHAWGFSLTWG